MIYAISALGIVAIIAVSMQRSSGSNEQNVYTNEVLTQLVTIGRDVVDDIGRQNLPFDAKVDPDRLPSSSTYPFVHSASELTSDSLFGGKDVGKTISTMDDADDIDDFHDLVISGERNNLEYEATITVAYVDEDDPNNAPAGGKSFAKEITVTVETDAIQVNGSPISAEYSRVLTYPRITNYAY